MDKNVLVIGNEYDLAYGLRMKYEHFIEWIEGGDKERLLYVKKERENLCPQCKKGANEKQN